MRLNRLGYLIKSGFTGIFSHGLMSFATVAIITACLIIMGAFSLLVVNINDMIAGLEDISGRQIILFVILSLYGGLTSQGVDNAAHIGGLVTGAILAAVLYRRKKKAPARIEQATAESRE